MNATEKENVFYCDCGFSWQHGMSGVHHCEDGLRVKLETAEKRIAELEARTKPIEFSVSLDDGMCRDYAWRYVKEALTPDGWTVGDNITYFGFFCWGWDMRRQYNEQRPVSVTLPEALIPAIHNSGEPFMRPEPFGLYLNRDDVLRALRAAGIGVKGD